MPRGCFQAVMILRVATSRRILVKCRKLVFLRGESFVILPPLYGDIAHDRHRVFNKLSSGSRIKWITLPILKGVTGSPGDNRAIKAPLISLNTQNLHATYWRMTFKENSNMSTIQVWRFPQERNNRYKVVVCKNCHILDITSCHIRQKIHCICIIIDKVDNLSIIYLANLSWNTYIQIVYIWFYSS